MNFIKLRKVAIQDLRGGSNFFQSEFWGLFKSYFGWKPFAFCYDQKPFLVLVRNLFPGFKIAYVPHGPDVDEKDKSRDFLFALKESIKGELPHFTVFIRFDLPWEGSFGVREFAGWDKNSHSRLLKASVDVQPSNTVLVSLNESEEAILQRMKSKTRYNIRLAEKKGVVITRGGREMLSSWYELYRQTALRDNITIHSKNYYEKIFRAAENSRGNSPFVVLFTASWEENLLGGIIVLIYGSRATYLYGASSNKKRNLMPNYALQWEAMKYAKTMGCEEYDLFGIPADNDPKDSMYGLYRFKTGFGGEKIRLAGCWDIPLKSMLYYIYIFFERLRIWYYKDFRKRQNSNA